MGHFPIHINSFIIQVQIIYPQSSRKLNIQNMQIDITSVWMMKHLNMINEAISNIGQITVIHFLLKYSNQQVYYYYPFSVNQG